MVDPRDEFYRRMSESAGGGPDFTVLQLLQTSSVVEQGLARQLQPSGLSPSSFNVLSILHTQENQCVALHEIGRLLLTSRANITGLVDSLCRRGLVERVPHPDDRRTKLARLLPAGEQLIEEQRPRLRAWKERVKRSLSETERQQLQELLARWRSDLLQPS